VSFFYFNKVVLLRVIHPLSTYQLTKFHIPTFTGASFALIDALIPKQNSCKKNVIFQEIKNSYPFYTRYFLFNLFMIAGE
jgi:hypothetical protein